MKKRNNPKVMIIIFIKFFEKTFKMSFWADFGRESEKTLSPSSYLILNTDRVFKTRFWDLSPNFGRRSELFLSVILLQELEEEG